MAMACSRFFTVPPLPPLPDLSVPLFILRIALSTVLPAALPYFRPPDFDPARFLAAIFSSLFIKTQRMNIQLRLQLQPDSKTVDSSRHARIPARNAIWFVLRARV